MTEKIEKLYEVKMLDTLREITDFIKEQERKKIENAKRCYFEEVPNEYTNMLYWEEYEYNNGFFYELDDLYEYCEEKNIPLPDYVYGTQTDMIHIDADSIVEQACEDLHEDAYCSIDYKDIKDLQKMLDDWCKEQTCTITYYPDYTYAIKVCRNDG